MSALVLETLHLRDFLLSRAKLVEKDLVGESRESYE